jgi:hypothetical protein
MQRENKWQDRFDSLTEDIQLDNPVCCERHDCLCSKITQREGIKEFIQSEIDRAVAERDEVWAKAVEKLTGGIIFNIPEYYKKVEEQLKELTDK